MADVVRRRLGWLTAVVLSLALTACGSGIEGVPLPPPIDMTQLQRPASPNTALAAPEGCNPTPDIITPIYDRPANDLYAALVDMAAHQARTYLLKRYDDRRQAHFVARNPVFGFRT